MVVKHVFSFDVSAEKMSRFIKWCTETAKPFFEKYPEIKSYDVFQTIAGKPMFIKEVVYEDMKAFCSMQAKGVDPETKKPKFEYHRQTLKYIENMLNNKKPCDIDLKIIDHTDQTIDLRIKGNTFKSENKPSPNYGSGSIVRSSIAASRHHK